ncbi:MAG: PqqD family protein [Pirellulales bacterium]
MTDSTYFALNEPQVVGELMDGEFVFVHFDTGCYYSIRETAADVCSLLFAGHSLADVIERIEQRHGGDHAEIERTVNHFVQQLLKENLIAPAAVRPSHAANVDLCSSSFTAPVFEKFDDMADQLLLDPIHEIDERGWPQRHAA